MARVTNGCALLFCVMLLACSPETILVRPGLDTPTHHLANGDILLKQDKLTDALREFQRASELDPGNVRALVGLANVHNRLGDSVQARKSLDRAALAATSDAERGVIQEAYRSLRRDVVSPEKAHGAD